MLDSNVPRPWQGQTTLVFALAVVAVGLGNFYRLPYLMGEHGGAPFFIAYAVTVMFVTAPILAAEVMLGSSGRSSPVGAIRWAADQSGREVHWSWLGGLQSLLALLVAAKLLLLSLWAMDRAQTISVGVLASASGVDVANNFAAMVADNAGLVGAGFVTALLAALLVTFGPAYAMGLIAWLGLPALVVASIGLLGYALEYGDLQAADEFLFARDYSGHGLGAVIAGAVSALYTLGAGLGVGICFGGRSPKSLPLLRAVAAAVVIDIAFSLLIALITIPIVYAVNVEPIDGLAYVFVAVPYAYANLPSGDVYGALFFALVASTSVFTMVALMEPAVMMLRREFHWHRWMAALVVAGSVAIMASLMAMSVVLDVLAAGAVDGLIPLAALVVSVFVGWRMPRPIVRSELYREPRWLFLLWWELIRLVVPLIVVVTLLVWWFGPISVL